MTISRRSALVVISMVIGIALLRAEPGIRVDSDARVLEAPSASEYQWYYNGAPIAGETEQILKVKAPGV